MARSAQKVPFGQSITNGGFSCAFLKKLRRRTFFVVVPFLQNSFPARDLRMKTDQGLQVRVNILFGWELSR